MAYAIKGVILLVLAVVMRFHVLAGDIFYDSCVLKKNGQSLTFIGILVRNCR
jgi:hypothetical protein